jgi:hypothetical protein
MNKYADKKIWNENQQIPYPLFVRMISPDGYKGAVLRLTTSIANYEYIYYRDAGVWSVRIRTSESGDLFSVSNIDSINGYKLIECTYDEYAKDNKGYNLSEVGAIMDIGMSQF